MSLQWVVNCTRTGMSTTEHTLTAAVTGASAGIGYQLAKELASRGYDLIVVAEDDGISNAALDFRQKGVSVTPVQVDLSTYEGVEKFYGELRAIGRPVDIVAINAGIGAGGDFARETDLQLELKLIDLNVRSSVHLAKRVLQDMVPRNQGRLLITASIAASAPGPLEAVYAASKAFLLSFSEALRNELSDTGITVTALMPGPTETNFFHRAGMDNTKVGQSQKDDAAQVAKEGIEAMFKG